MPTWNFSASFFFFPVTYDALLVHLQEIYDQEKHIQALKKAIRDKEAPLKVCGKLCTASY